MHWYKFRGYPHFDQSVKVKDACALVTNPARVSAHSFWPFISYERVEHRIDWETRTPSTKTRAVAYASHIDSHIYAYYSETLGKAYECELIRRKLDNVVLAYRKLVPRRSNIDFAREAFEQIRKLGACTAICIDLSKYFDTIDHAILKQRWCTILGSPTLPNDHYAVFKSLTRHSHVERNWLHQHFNVPRKNRKRKGRICTPEQFRNIVRNGGKIKRNKNGCGIPQGSPISALLSNIYLLDFDEALNACAAAHGGFYRRYCDDILVVCPHPHKATVEGVIYSLVESHKLTMNEGKRDDVEFLLGSSLVANHPMQYLGFVFDGSRTRVRSSSIARFYRRMHERLLRARFSASRSQATKRIFLGPLYEQYTHLGKNNFVSYVYRAAKAMHDTGIRRQVRAHWQRLHTALSRPVPKPT